SKYNMRWGIECMFRDLKDNLGFDQYQTRSLKAISRHWHFTFVAYSFLIYAKLNSIFSKMVSIPLNTIGNLISAFRRINTRSSQSWITRHKEKFYAFLGVKEPKLA
ncbi:MAG: transposase, partial [Candidatus Omnitrophota bacterium]|nr:transposase [Candidatus Omnitrophota bacterium]